MTSYPEEYVIQENNIALHNLHVFFILSDTNSKLTQYYENLNHSYQITNHLNYFGNGIKEENHFYAKIISINKNLYR